MGKYTKFVKMSLAASAFLATQLMADFYVMVNNKQEGPFSVEKIKTMAQQGEVKPTTLVWQAGMANWDKAAAQAELKPIFAPPPPPPPSAGTPPPPPPVAASSSASGSVGSGDIAEQNRLSDANLIPNPDAADSVEDWSETVLQKFGVDSFGENNGKYILFAQQSVSLKPIDPQYGDAVINAFDKAMMKIQEEYVMARFGRIATEKLRSFFSDRSTNAKELELPSPSSPTFFGKLMILLDKQLELKGKELDKKLIEMGVSPESLKNATPTVKKDLFRDKFVKTTMQKASGSMAGLVPVQTTVVRDNNGKTVIGVVAIASPKTIQIAKDISLQRKPVIKGRGRDIITLLPQLPKEYLATLGVRLVYDKDGTPAIISYGMASYRPDSGDDYINDELREEAKNAAVANADAQIAEMVNGYMSVKNERKTGEETRKYIEREVKFDSDTLEKEVKNIIKTVNKNAKSAASVRLQGISTVKRWRYTSKKTGLHFVGAVRVWRYATLKAAKEFNKPVAHHKKKKVYHNFQQESRSVNSMDDF